MEDGQTCVLPVMVPESLVFDGTSHDTPEGLQDLVQHFPSLRSLHNDPSAGVQSQLSSAGNTVLSDPFSAPLRVDSSLDASLTFEDVIPQKKSIADMEPPAPPADTRMDEQGNTNLLESGHADLDPKPNGVVDGWRRVKSSTQLAEGPMTKMEFIQRQQEKLRGAYRNVKRLRTATLQTRLGVHELRNQLRHKREEASSADVRFMKAFHSFFATHMSQEGPEEANELIALYKDCSKERDDYHPLEMTYNTREDQLDQEEYELDEAEKKLYERQRNASELEETTILVDYESRPSSATSGDAFIEYPSVAKEYFSCRGDADLARERLHEHRARRASLVETERLRKQYGYALDEESQTFLAHFDSVHERLRDELTKLESKLEKLTKSCIEDGLSGLIEHSDLDELLLPDDSPLENDSLKFNDADAMLRFSDLNRIDEFQRNEPIERTKFINDWLLRSLRGSRQEISNLKIMIGSLLARTGVAMASYDVNNRVLEWWFKDDAALPYVILGTSLRGHSIPSARKPMSLQDEKELPDTSAFCSSWSL